ncbi:hypothetical protein B484DRAFT_448158 [Ochromonadaceae sp. CCMP2298]|nr:hypothetical protein B484DRAFT_448158 [Ochromonadaceae sp. CCMP2298]
MLAQLFVLVGLLSCAASLRLSMTARPPLTGKALILQNKGGGHGTVGYQLCKELVAANPGLEVTMLQDECNYKKTPFDSYADLEALGVKIVNAKLGEKTDLTADYIVDNWSKRPENAAWAIGIAKASNAKQLMFISSAGMYKPDGVTPHTETDSVKTNDPRTVELAVQESGVPYTFMRPQYLYGPKISKRYLDFFIARVTRSLPMPLPLSGEQLVALTHIEDCASLLAAAVGHPAALNEVFNCGTDRYVSYKGICDMVHDTLGTPAEERKFMYYDPKDFVHWKGSGAQVFPFRRDTFTTTPSKAKLLLGWAPKHLFTEDVGAEVADYQGSKDAAVEWDAEFLKHDMEVLASKHFEFMYTYAFFDDERVKVDESRPDSFEPAAQQQ